jgi:hypothetical protein
MSSVRPLLHQQAEASAPSAKSAHAVPPTTFSPFVFITIQIPFSVTPPYFHIHTKPPDCHLVRIPFKRFARPSVPPSQVTHLLMFPDSCFLLLLFFALAPFVFNGLHTFYENKGGVPARSGSLTRMPLALRRLPYFFVRWLSIDFSRSFISSIRCSSRSSRSATACCVASASPFSVSPSLALAALRFSSF